MKILDIEQGSDEWLQARLGLPTASNADRLLTPKGRNPSAQAVTYRNQLLAEWLLDFPVEWNDATEFMERGKALEPEARAWYELQKDVEVEQIGFILRDDEQFGGSPDGLVGEDGGLEIKCPAIHTHIGYMLDEGPDYTGQLQALMYVSERSWWDILSYHPDLPPVVHRVERDEEYISDFEKVLNAFIENLIEGRERLAEHKDSRVEAESHADEEYTTYVAESMA